MGFLEYSNVSASVIASVLIFQEMLKEAVTGMGGQSLGMVTFARSVMLLFSSLKRPYG